MKVTIEGPGSFKVTVEAADGVPQMEAALRAVIRIIEVREERK